MSLRILVLSLVAGLAEAQTPSVEIKDPLGRDTPQGSMYRFLEECHDEDYAKASYYLDLRTMPPAERAKSGPVLAHQLQDLLDNTPFDIATLSLEKEGDTSDGLEAELEGLANFDVHGQRLAMKLERVELKPGLDVWLVSAESIPMIPIAHQLVTETPFEKRLPRQLVSVDILNTPIWRWIALLLTVVLLWFGLGGVSRILVSITKSQIAAKLCPGPVRTMICAAGVWHALDYAPPAALPRLYIERGLGLVFFTSVAWALAVTLDLAAESWHSNLNPREQAVSYSVLPLGRQVIKLSLYVIAVVGVLGHWGYNTSTILAGLGVGGLAVALAAQKTIENLFGGISVLSDRPVLVGDECRFEGRIGTIIHIGLRSTRIRTSERTIISVPNGEFSTAPLENLSARDKSWLHHTLRLPQDTTTSKLHALLVALREVLAREPKVEPARAVVRLVAIGPQGLEIEVDAYIETKQNEEFLELQERLLLEFLREAERTGVTVA